MKNIHTQNIIYEYTIQVCLEIVTTCVFINPPEVLRKNTIIK